MLYIYTKLLLSIRALGYPNKNGLFLLDIVILFENRILSYSNFHFNFLIVFFMQVIFFKKQSFPGYCKIRSNNKQSICNLKSLNILIYFYRVH